MDGNASSYDCDNPMAASLTTVGKKCDSRGTDGSGGGAGVDGYAGGENNGGLVF